MNNKVDSILFFLPVWRPLLNGDSVDTRDADFHAAEQWSGDDILGQRATFRADRHPSAALILTNVKLRDEGLYRCRVDFRLAQTRNAHVNLTVIGKPHFPHFPLLFHASCSVSTD